MNIPAVIKEGTSQSLSTKDITVMVPEDYLDEAHVIIESQDVYDDFCDYVFEDSDEQSLDEFDDDFDERGFWALTADNQKIIAAQLPGTYIAYVCKFDESEPGETNG